MNSQNSKVPYRPCFKCGNELYGSNYPVIVCQCGIEYSNDLLYWTSTGEWFNMYFEEGYSVKVKEHDVVVTRVTGEETDLE